MLHQKRAPGWPRCCSAGRRAGGGGRARPGPLAARPPAGSRTGSALAPPAVSARSRWARRGRRCSWPPPSPPLLPHRFLVIMATLLGLQESIFFALLNDAV